VSTAPSSPASAPESVIAPSAGRRLREATALFLLLVFPGVVLLLVYPLAIFNHNSAELGGNPRLLSRFFEAAALVTGFCALAGFLLTFVRPAWRHAVAALAFWLGSSFILNDLVTPLQLTQAIGFSGTESIIAPTGMAIVLDSVLLTGSLLLFWRWRHDGLLRIAPPVVFVFVLITLGPALYKFDKATDQVRQTHAKAKWLSIPPPSTRSVPHPNVYHIILDGFRGSMFKAALAEAGLTNADFAGFTFYPKNRSNFDGTQASTPVFLTGTLYRGGSFRNWHNSWTSTGIFAEVKTRLGTNIQAYSFGAYHQLTRWIQGRQIENTDVTRKNQDIILHLALARAAPSGLRAGLFQHGTGVLSHWFRALGTDSRVEPLFLLRQDEALRPRSGQYVFAHIYFPHAPFLIDRLGQRSPNANLLSQSAYALRCVAEFLTELKHAGHYNDSVIVIHSDHGWGDQVPATEGQLVPEGIQIETWPRSAQELDYWTSALLLVKPAQATGKALIESPRPTQLLDLPNTLYDLLGLPPLAPEGKSVLASDYPADPERHIFTGFRRWDPVKRRQLWFGQDFQEGELNHFIWTEAGGLKIEARLPVTWEAPPLQLPAGSPTPLDARRLQPDLVELTWPAAAAEGEYEIQMAAGDAEFATIGHGGAVTARYIVNQLLPGTTYHFRARWSVYQQTYDWSKVVTLPPQ